MNFNGTTYIDTNKSQALFSFSIPRSSNKHQRANQSTDEEDDQAFEKCKILGK